MTLRANRSTTAGRLTLSESRLTARAPAITFGRERKNTERDPSAPEDTSLSPYAPASVRGSSLFRVASADV